MKPIFLRLVHRLIAIVALWAAHDARAQTAFEQLYQFEAGTNPLPDLALGTDGNYYGATGLGGTADLGTVFRLTPAGVLTTILSFNQVNGSYPEWGLLRGGDGNFYGTTSSSMDGSATVFRITPAGVLTTLAKFDPTTGDRSTGRLVRTSNGTLYGTTEESVFKIPPGGGVTTLARFQGGGNRAMGLVQGNDGNFYGTTYLGGATGRGSAFKVTPAGTLTKLLDFGIEVGAFPNPGLVQGVDGNFYGTTGDWGAHTRGTAFRFTPSGSLTVLHHFGSGGQWGDAVDPNAGLVRGSDGNFYGVTGAGGANNWGAVYKMTPAGAVSVLASFDATNGSPYSALVQGSDGSFRGVGREMIFRVTTTGSFTTAASFTSPNGRSPFGLVKRSDGSIYGVTAGGGAYGFGTMFKLTSAGALTTVGSFEGTNGSYPANLVEGMDGNFYGMAPGGPTNPGAFFKVTPAGALTAILPVNDNWRNGLTRGNDGNFYSTTYAGGPNGEGTFFRITPTGTVTTLASFTLASGRYPDLKMLLASDGDFYGTTWSGGQTDLRAFYKVAPAGVLTPLAPISVDFSGPLVEGLDGNFYGTTSTGGTHGHGTISRITPAGNVTTFASFNITNGSGPYGGLTKGSDGNFYGTTLGGGAFESWGTVFKVTPAGVITTLHSFDGVTGAGPGNPPIFGSDDKLYGTASHMVYRIALDTTTLPPVLGAPAANSVAGPSVAVSFSLPEGASAGSVKLIFDDGGMSRVITLAASQETAGAHAFSINPTDPMASAAVAAGSPIPNGTYAVRLSYQDALGNPAVESAIAENVRIDAVPTSFASWQAGKFSPSELSDVNISGGGADPESDGIVNVLEYALALQPHVSDSAALPVGSIQDVGGIRYLTIAFRRRLTVGDLAYTPRAADSPAGPWAATAVQVGPTTANADGTETVTFRDSLPVSNGKRFMHLQVTLSP